MDYTMKLSTLLLSSAALLVAGAAYAADLPAKKAAPAAAPTGCAAFGAGYIAVPGGDTCLKISGYVRSNNEYLSNQDRGTAPYKLNGNYGIHFNAKNQTEMGAVTSEIFIEDNATTDAYVSLGGLTAGKADDMFDIGGGYNHSGHAYGPHVGQIMYTMPIGATTLKVAAITAQDNNAADFGTTNAALSASRPDLEAQLSTKVGALAVSAGLASHEVVGYSSGTAQGIAFIGQAKYDAGVASFMGYAAYANGASGYIHGGTYSKAAWSATNFGDSDADASNLSKGTNYQAQVDIPLGKNDSVGFIYDTVKVTQSGVNGDAAYDRKEYAAALTHTIAKGLILTPEIYQDTINGVVTNGAYIRIERDF
jgi:Porin subfamily